MRLLPILALLAGSAVASTAVAAADPLHATGFFHDSGLSQLIGGPVTYVVLGFVILATMYATATGRIQAAFFGILAVLGTVFVRYLVVHYFSTAPNVPAVTEIDWPVFGANASSGVQSTTQEVNYGVIQGYALAGVYFLSRLLRGCFTTGLIPVALTVSALVAMYRVQKEQSPGPLIRFLLFLVLVGGFGLLPTVHVKTPLGTNPVLSTLQSFQHQGDANDNNDVPLIAAVLFTATNDFAQSIGSTLSIRDRGFDQIVVQAMHDARLDKSVEGTYFAFADNCQTSVLNLSRLATTSPDAVSRLATEKQSLLREYRNTPYWRRNALSAASQRLFEDVDYDGFVFNDRDDALTSQPEAKAGEPIVDRLNNSLYVKTHADEFMSPIPMVEPALAPERLGTVTAVLEGGLAKLRADHLDVANVLTPRPAYLTRPLLAAEPGWPQFSNRARMFCALAKPPTNLFNEDLSWNSPLVRNVASLPETLSEQWKTVSQASNPGIRLHDCLRYLQMQISMRYNGPDADRTCERATLNTANSADFWGCLLAGRYERPYFDEPKFARARGASHRLWDFRTQLEDAAYGADDDRGTSFNPGHDLSPSSLEDHRSFTNLFMLAPGIQRQVGLDPGVLRTLGNGSSGASGFDRLTNGLGGGMIGSLPSLIARLGSLFSRLALAMYPHALGLATLFLLLTYTFFPGKGGVILEWGKAVLWLSLWPVSILFGICLINQSGVFSMTDLLAQSNGEGDMSNAILQIFGAMFIFMAPTFTASLLGMSFGALSSAIGMIAERGFLFTGMGASMMGGLGGAAASSAATRIAPAAGAPAPAAASQAAAATTAATSSAPALSSPVGAAGQSSINDLASAARAGDFGGVMAKLQQSGMMSAVSALLGGDSFTQGSMLAAREGRGQSTAEDMYLRYGPKNVMTRQALAMEGMTNGGEGVSSTQIGTGSAGADTAPAQPSRYAVSSVPGASAAAREAMRLGDHHAGQARSLLATGSHDSAATAYSTAMIQFGQAGMPLHQIEAGGLAVQEYLAAGKLDDARTTGLNVVSEAKAVLSRTNGVGPAAAQANAVIGSVETALGGAELSAARRAASPRDQMRLLGSGGMRLNEARQPLAEASQFYSQRAKDLGTEIAANGGDAEAWSTFEHNATKAVEVASTLDRHAALTGEAHGGQRQRTIKGLHDAIAKTDRHGVLARIADLGKAPKPAPVRS